MTQSREMLVAHPTVHGPLTKVDREGVHSSSAEMIRRLPPLLAQGLKVVALRVCSSVTADACRREPTLGTSVGTSGLGGGP